MLSLYSMIPRASDLPAEQSHLAVLPACGLPRPRISDAGLSWVAILGLCPLDLTVPFRVPMLIYSCSLAFPIPHTDI